MNNTDPFEYIHMKFIKEILVVHYKATNAACMVELARLPLKSKVQAAAINFWEHVITSHNTLVNKIYCLTERTNAWVKKVKDVVSTLSYSFINSVPVTMIPIHVKHIQKRIRHDVAIQEQDSVILNSTKLDFYKNIYKIHTM